MVEKKKDLKKLWVIKTQLHNHRHLQCLKNRNFHFIKELKKLKLGEIS
jgi:4-hydroxy-3-methylbut-2-enyl diphosphate reductase IspH